MMNFTRRQFFREFFSGVVDNVSNRIPRFNSSSSESWISVGSLKDFMPGTRTKVNNNQQIIISTNYGLMATDIDDETVRPLRMDKSGNIQLNVHSSWPNDSALCIMTGRRITEIKEEM